VRRFSLDKNEKHEQPAIPECHSDSESAFCLCSSHCSVVNMTSLIRLAKPASEWTSNDLKAFNIVVEEQTTEVFFGGPLPECTGPPAFVRFKDCPEGELISEVDLESRSLLTSLEGVMKLVEGKPEEGFVTDFTVDLLRAMGYTAVDLSKLLVRRRKSIPLLMCGEMVYTRPDVCVFHTAEGVLLVTLEDGSRFELDVDNTTTRTPEAQLIAQAIAAFQENNRKRLEPLEQAQICGILMDRSFPKFYKIEVTKVLNQAIRHGLYPDTTTTVYCHTPQVPREVIDGMVPLDNRKILLRCFEAFKRIVF